MCNFGFSVTQLQIPNINPSYMLVEKAMARWRKRNFRADNTSVITVMLDPQGPARATVLQKHLNLQVSSLLWPFVPLSIYFFVTF